jgi:hypothetical protein
VETRTQWARSDRVELDHTEIILVLSGTGQLVVDDAAVGNREGGKNRCRRADAVDG